MKHLARLALVVALGGCDGDDPGGSRVVELGECAPPAGATLQGTATANLTASECLRAPSGDLVVIESQAQWDAQFGCPTPVPDGVDLTAARVALIQVYCTPIDLRFVAETADEVALGIYQRVSGACLGNPLVVPLRRAATPVRLARCRESCEGDCPPVP